MKIAIVTGASSGLGKEFAGEIIEKHQELDEVWLIARRKERLEKIRQKYPEKTIRAVPLDLGKDDSYVELEKLLDETRPDIRILVSNAGIGTRGNFDEKDLASQLDMLNLNAKGCVALTRLCLPYMSEGSFIVETCSVCSFVPNPKMAVYSGTKALVLYFSQAIRKELKPRGINVCALCPGNMDSEMKILAERQGKQSIVNQLPYLDMRVVARTSLKAAQKGRAVYTPGLFYKFYRVMGKILPHNLLMVFTEG